MLINTEGTTEWPTLANIFEHVEVAQKSAKLVETMDARQETVERKTEYRQNNPKQVDGRSRTKKAQGRPSMGNSKGKQNKGKCKCKLGKDTGKNTKQTKGRTPLQEREGRISRSGWARRNTRNTNQSRIHRMDEERWTNDGSTELWDELEWEQAARQLVLLQPAEEQSEPTHGRST